MQFAWVREAESKATCVWGQNQLQLACGWQNENAEFMCWGAESKAIWLWGGRIRGNLFVGRQNQRQLVCGGAESEATCIRHRYRALAGLLDFTWLMAWQNQLNYDEVSLVAFSLMACSLVAFLAC